MNKMYGKKIKSLELKQNFKLCIFALHFNKITLIGNLDLG